MPVTSRYTAEYTRDVVTVEKIGAIGALCKTSYGAEITVNWGTNIPSPVPRLGERWYVQRISPSRWAFESKITGTSYSIMRCSIKLDMSSCIGRERSVVDHMVDMGISEVYLKVASSGVVYWDSDVAGEYGLSTLNVDDEPFDYVKQVVNRCESAGISVVFTIGCDLWSDVRNSRHNYYQQVKLSDEYLGSVDYQYSTPRDDNSEHVPVWSFVTAKHAVKTLVMELYERYGGSVRGVCFDGWRVGGAYADVSDYVNGEFVRNHSEPIYKVLAENRFSDAWWAKRRDVASFYRSLQESFVSDIAGSVGNWPISAIVPKSTLSLSSERAGGFDTWVGDDFALFGWSQVGCPLGYSRSVDDRFELYSFEYLVACMQRFGEGSTPLYVIDVSETVDYRGMFEILAKYNVTNVLIDGYDKLCNLSEQSLSELKVVINETSVTPITTTSEFGVLLSSNSRDVSYYDDFDKNRFLRQAQEFCVETLGKLSHRLRIYYDQDVENARNFDGISTLVLFHSLNMSDDAISSIRKAIGGKNVVIVGMCGMFDIDGVEQRSALPFIDMFGVSDGGLNSYGSFVSISGGDGVFNDVYALDGECEGIVPVSLGEIDGGLVATGKDTSGNDVPLPIYSHGRSFAIAMDVMDEPSLIDMASDMVLVAIGRSD